MTSFIVTAITSIIVFLLVILIHEFGHFAVAKAVGIKVNEFSIGMGPSIYSKQAEETLYSVRALPIGGYVAMEGEEEATSDPRSFNNAPIFKRILVVAAGAFMNFVLAIVVLVIIGLSLGSATTTIADFTEESTAKSAGIISGDRIISIDGNEVDSWQEIINLISSSKSEKLDIGINRDGENKVFKVDRGEEGKIGIISKTERSFSGAISYAFSTIAFITVEIFKFFQRLFTGSVSFNEVSGPVGIIVQIGTAARTGILNVLLLLAFININVGIFNLLPIPALDGSKIVILIIESIRKKPMPQEKEGLINLIGFVLLIGLLIVVTFKDIVNFGHFGG
ncbi:MAG: RIP metalloprotease RseP [Tissierellia bacterium]|nr:RIP metalloprotease RseP [Tissierellia bacterium]